MDFYILISPRDTQYIVFGALLYGFLRFFSVSRIHCYGEKKAFNKSQGNGHQVSCSLVIQAMSATVILVFLGFAFTGLMFLFNNFFCVYFKALLSIRILIYIKVPTKWYITWPYLRNKFFSLTRTEAIIQSPYLIQNGCKLDSYQKLAPIL